MSWDQKTAAATCPSGFHTAVWSPCNRFIAIPSGATIVAVLDSVTLQQLQTLKLPQDVPTYYRALIFSPDSHILTCSGGIRGGDLGEELFVISWDLQTGGIASIIRWKAPGQKLMGTPSMTYSANGEMVGVFYWYKNNTNATKIFICNIASGVYMHSYSLNADIPLSNNIWTHGESLQFATANATTITIWEVGFISGSTPTKVKTFPAPDNVDPTMFVRMGRNKHMNPIQLLPTPCRLALVFMDKVLVWDVWNSKCLLDCKNTNFLPYMTFSSNGCFFACSASHGIYLWKEFPTGYVLHKILQLHNRVVSIPLLSQNGESIAIVCGCTIQLWHTNSTPTCPSSPFTQDFQPVKDFVLDFSPDRTLAVVAMRDTNTVTVLNLKSGVPQLTIDAGMRVENLSVIGNTIAAMILKDMAVTLDGSQGDWDSVSGVSISPDSHYIALITVGHWEYGGSRQLYIYNASTGECLGHKLTHLDLLEDLKHRVDVKHPPEEYPWRSSCGYQVTQDWWILAPDGKRLLMLPPPWQYYPERRVWKGQFLALLHEGLSEPVILELEP
jgi:WD40 repeat protein